MQQDGLEIVTVPCLNDNYAYLLRDADGATAVIDAPEAAPIEAALDERGWGLDWIWLTHHHGDHVGGNSALLRQFPNATVYGGAADQGRIPGQQVFLQEGDEVRFGDRPAQVFFVPGHTRAHIAYYFPPTQGNEPGELFCGDTLFAGGCGRLFEGTPAQMVNSLSKLRNLPDNTRVWCAHEYTLKNLQFACAVDPTNGELQTRQHTVATQRQRNEATVPSWLGIEKATNPFLRWDNPTLQHAMQTTDPIQSFARLRGKKDQW